MFRGLIVAIVRVGMGVEVLGGGSEVRCLWCSCFFMAQRTQPCTRQRENVAVSRHHTAPACVYTCLDSDFKVT
jgi:hypothetical protein